jgi:hypothetical protein
VLRHAYQLELIDLAAIYLAQWWRCAGCKDDLTGPMAGRRGDHIDHDHLTGELRGILCKGCNIALGVVRDSPDTLFRLAAYLTACRRKNEL